MPGGHGGPEDWLGGNLNAEAAAADPAARSESAAPGGAEAFLSYWPPPPARARPGNLNCTGRLALAWAAIMPVMRTVRAASVSAGPACPSHGPAVLRLSRSGSGCQGSSGRRHWANQLASLTRHGQPRDAASEDD
jgi:hypothetical protein